MINLQQFSDENRELLKNFYFRTTDLWKRLCEEHHTLLDATFEEYRHLIDGQIDDLETTISQKVDIIERINILEDVRYQLIHDLNIFLREHTSQYKNVKSPILKVSDLLILMQTIESEVFEKHLFRFNELLIDIIEKIKEQNKRNQLFINKAIHSLQLLKEEVKGKKTFSTYNARGKENI